MKGMDATHLARADGKRRQNFVGQHFWARGHIATKVARNEAMIRAYIRNQEKGCRRLDQLNIWK